MTPDIEQSVRQSRETPKGRALQGAYQSTYCVFRSKEGDLTVFETDLNQELAQLERMKPVLLGLVGNGGALELFIGIFLETNDGFTLSSEILRKATALNISLAFDLYGKD